MAAKPPSTLEPVRLEDGPGLRLCGLSARFRFSDTSGIAPMWERFMSQFFDQIPGRVGRLVYGVSYNQDAASGHFDYLCGAEASAGFQPDPAGTPELASLDLPARRYAVFEHRDHISTIGKTFQAIFRVALPASGLQAAPAPFFERYDERFNPSGDGVVEIWVPVV